MTAAAVTTGNAILLTANGVTSGNLLKLVTTASGFSGGTFITCDDGSARFSVGVDGATLIASGVNSTKALEVTGIQTSENMVTFSSNGVTASGYATLKVTAAGATAAGSAVLLVTATGTPAASTSYLAHFDYTGATEETNDPITVQISSGASVGAALNISSTATTITGGVVNITNAEMTTGVGINMTGMTALTTGQAIKLAHATSAIGDGGSMIADASSGVNTGGATNGTLLDLKATGQLAGTLDRLDSIQTTGTAMSVISTGIMTTTGNLLTLTANAATTAAGILRINANGLTDGIGLVITSSCTALTATGSLLSVNHTGTTSTSGVLVKMASAATDETTILGITASAANAAGNALLITTATTTGNGINITANSLTSGKAINVTASSASTDGSTSFETALFSTTMTGAGGVGGRVRAYMTANVALGSWSNALKGEVTYGATGKTTGLGSAICAEMTLSAGTVDGNYAPLELELNLGSSAAVGTASQLVYASVNGADAATFSTSGHILNLQGLTAGANNIFRTGLSAGTVNAASTAALRIMIGSTPYYIVLATATA